MVCGVSVSPGVPRYSVRWYEERSRRRSARSSRSRGVGTEVGDVGGGTRSPGRIPASSAAAVGRITLICLEGPGWVTRLASRRAVPAVCVASGVAAGGAADGSAGPTASLGAAGLACSARTAGVSFFTRRVALAGFAVGMGVVSGSGGAASAASGSTASSNSGARASSTTGRAARFTTLMVRFTAVSFLGKYFVRIFSANSFEIELDGTLTSTPSRRTSSISRLVSSLSSLAKS